MEKARRKRINNCLGQLRSLLPFSNLMKRDMASLLEQTVEYINTMHTVLNEEKPACLSRIYLTYQKRIEEYDFCRKACTPKSTKRKFPSGGSHSSDQQTSPVTYQSYPGDSYDMQEPGTMNNSAKRYCSLLPHDQSIVQQEMSTPIGSSMQNCNLQQQIVEPAVNINNNNFIPPFLSCSSDHQGINTTRYLFGQSPLPNPYGIPQKQSHQFSSYSTSQFLPPFTKIMYTDTGLPKPAVQYASSPTNDQHWQREVVRTEYSGRHSVISHKDGINVEKSAGKNYKQQNFLDVSSLVGNHDKRDTTQIHNPSPWRQHDFTSVVPFNPMISKSDNPTHNLLAPMDMSVSPPTDGQPTTSSQFMGVNRLICRGFTTNREIDLMRKPLSVSTMLNEVAGISNMEYSSRYGSTDHKVTPMFSSCNVDHPQVAQSDILPSTSTEENTSNVVRDTSEFFTPSTSSNLFTPPTLSSSEKLTKDISMKSDPAASSSHTSSTTATAISNGRQVQAAPQSQSSDNNNIQAEMKVDENNNLTKEESGSSSTPSTF